MKIKGKVLVTGGAGFIGTHLCRSLLERDEQVLCLDNFTTSRRDSLAPFLRNPGFQSVEHDVTVPFICETEKIYNLACPASPVQYQKDPVNTLKTNVYGAVNALDLARKSGARILQASTSEVYGDPEVHPQPEEYAGRVNPIGLRSCYDEGKRCAESLFFDYHRQYGLPVKVARIFNTYGPGMAVDDGRVVSSFIVQALRGEDITLFGNGLQTRSFLFVSDLVDGLLAFMDLPKEEPGPLNLGNPEEITMLALAEKILHLTGSSSAIAHRPLPPDDPVRRKPDISRARRLLNFTPKISLDEGLEETIRYFRSAPGVRG